MDPHQLERVLARLMATQDTARRVKAVLPVHAFGQVADMPQILAAAGRYEIPVIEDAACALGATLNGKAAGAWGVMGCFSFHPRKAITTGEGGAITTDDPQLALRNHGLDPDAAAPDFVMPGFNCRLTEFQGALGLTQMNKVERIVRARREAAQRYDRLFEGGPLTPPFVEAGSEPVYQSYVALLPPGKTARRAEWIGEWKRRGVETTIGTWHMPLTSYFQKRYGFEAGDFPVADAVFARALTLPLFEGITEEQQATVAREIGRTLAEEPLL
jgi:perosamine synthetase